MSDSLNEGISLALTIGVLGLLIYFFRRKASSRRARSERITLTVTDAHFQIAYDKRSSPLVTWDSVRCVTWVSSTKGPTQDSVYYHVAHDGGDLSIPAGAPGLTQFIDHLSARAGFHAAAYAACRTSTSTECFAVIYGERNDTK